MNDTRQPEGGSPQPETTTVHDQTTAQARPRAGGRGAEPAVEPQLPHEIDESTHSQRRDAEAQVHAGERAYADATGPGCDTDRGPVLDEVYKRSVAPDRGQGRPRR